MGGRAQGAGLSPTAFQASSEVVPLGMEQDPRISSGGLILCHNVGPSNELSFFDFLRCIYVFIFGPADL